MWREWQEYLRNGACKILQIHQTRSQTLHLSPLCWCPSATKKTADGSWEAWEWSLPDPSKNSPQLYNTHTHTCTLTLSGSSVWVNRALPDIPTVRQIWECHLTWFWMWATAEDSRGAERLSSICSAAHDIIDVLIYTDVYSVLKSHSTKHWAMDFFFLKTKHMEDFFFLITIIHNDI